MAEKGAETEEAVAEVTAETVPEEMAENVTDEVAATEIITVKMAETEEVIKSVKNFRDFSGGYPPKKNLKHGLKWHNNIRKIKSKLFRLMYLLQCSAMRVL